MPHFLDKNEHAKPDWWKTDITLLSDLAVFPYFNFIKMFNYVLTSSILLFLLLTKLFISDFQALTVEDVQFVYEIQTYDAHNAILIGTSLSIVISMLVISSIIESNFAEKLSNFKMLEFIGDRRGFRSLYIAIKSPYIVPKGFDVILSFAWGLFGIFFFVFLMIINQENSTILESLSFLVSYTTFFYCLMMSVFIVFSPYSLLNSFILFLIILFPRYLNGKQLLPESYEHQFVFWLPIITLYVLPMIARYIKKQRIHVHTNRESSI